MGISVNLNDDYNVNIIINNVYYIFFLFDSLEWPLHRLSYKMGEM